ncbi:MAG: LuxR C-terminal-related transcriptional regulator [Kistimonas sp.]|nr:LuxR C-terminal-related transcriptional regulator [Kistimonas sp.]
MHRLAYDAEATVFIVDGNDGEERESLVSLTLSAGYRVTVFSSEQELMCGQLTDGPGCILLDTRTLHSQGTHLLEQLHYTHYSLPVVFIAEAGQLAVAVRNIREGGFGLVAKPFHEQDLLQAVKEAMDESHRRRDRNNRSREVVERLSALSLREKAVLDLLIRGYSNKMIADALHLSPRTVEGHRARLMAKMGASSLAALITKYLLARPGADPAKLDIPRTE